MSVLFFITVIDYILLSAIRKFSSVGQRMQQAFSFAYTSSPFVHPALKQFSLKGINSLEALLCPASLKFQRVRRQPFLWPPSMDTPEIAPGGQIFLESLL